MAMLRELLMLSLVGDIFSSWQIIDFCAIFFHIVSGFFALATAALTSFKSYLIIYACSYNRR
jgi:hypothetical protein